MNSILQLSFGFVKRRQASVGTVREESTAVSEALVRAHRALARHGCGTLVHDAYRAWSVTWVFREATPSNPHEFVADPAKGSRHNRGCAVELGTYELASGAVVAPDRLDDSERAGAYFRHSTGTGGVWG